MKSSLPLLTGLIILSQSVLSASAAVPTSPPTVGVPGGGYFSQYFDNIANQTYSVANTAGSPCGTNAVIVGFETNPGTTFLSSRCRNMNTFLGAIMTSTVGGAGQAVTAFNPTTGAPIYSLVSGAASQWSGISPGNIYYNTPGNVGIGTSAPAYKLDVNSDVINNGW